MLRETDVSHVFSEKYQQVRKPGISMSLKDTLFFFFYIFSYVLSYGHDMEEKISYICPMIFPQHLPSRILFPQE